MFTVSDLLDNLTPTDTMAIKKLEKILKLTKKPERDKLTIAINALLKLNLIEQEEEGYIKKSSENGLIEAKIRCSSKGYCFAVRDNEAEDIYIREQYLNNAWHGDRVLVKIIKEGLRRRSPEGQILCIIERKTKNLIAVIDKEDLNYAKPLDDRIQAKIKITNKQKIDLEMNEDGLIEIQINRFPLAQLDAEGTIIRPLTLEGGIEGDINIILTKNNHQINNGILKGSLKQPNPKNRVDLTNQKVFLLNSWSGSSHPALPAFSIEPDNGGVKLWVHIPTIAERITPGNSLDNLLQKTGDAHCLGDRWLPLLPDNLTKASKFEIGKDSDAITAILDINSDGFIIDWEFVLSKINPTTNISNDELKLISERKPKARLIPKSLKSLKDDINDIQTLIYASKLLVNSEKELGYIELDLPIPKIDKLGDLIYQDPSSEWNQWKLPLKFHETNSVISPLIRAVNRSWLDHINYLNLPGVIIDSGTVDKTTLYDVAKSALALDIKLELTDEGATTASILVEAFENTSSKRVLEKLLRHAIKAPNYKSKANDYDLYKSTKMLAPICSSSIHYADIINQFIQVSLLRDSKNKSNTRSRQTINLGKRNCLDKVDWDFISETQNELYKKIINPKVIYNLNNNLSKAKAIKYGLISIAQSRSAQPLIGQIVTGIISGVQSYGFFVEIPESNAEGLVHVSSLNDDWYEYRSRQSCLVGRKSKRTYQLGDQVNIRILKVDILKNQIDLEVIQSDDIKNTSESPQLIEDSK